ncbi:hypothetical protein ACFFH6_02805 [Halomonas organivorans]
MNDPHTPPGSQTGQASRARADLITSTSRLAFEIEAAERDDDRLTELRLRVRYHTEMAELMRLTPAWAAPVARVRDNRCGHLELLSTYALELAQLEGQG